MQVILLWNAGLLVLSDIDVECVLDVVVSFRIERSFRKVSRKLSHETEVDGACPGSEVPFGESQNSHLGFETSVLNG